jgi:hypothetical protein
MKNKMPSPFKVDSEEFASVVYMSEVKPGNQVIDVKMETLTPEQARRLAAWLLKAADYVSSQKRSLDGSLSKWENSATFEY